MIVFLLFAVINLLAGFACAVMLGYGPRPWYALFLPSSGNNVVRIEVIDAEAETPSAPAASPVKEAAAPPKPAPEPPPAAQAAVVEQVVENVAEEALPEEPVAPLVSEPVAEVKPEAPPEPVTQQPTPEEKPAAEVKAEAKPPGQLEEIEHELEDYLAGLRDEPTAETEAKPEVASLDDIEAMFASATRSAAGDEPETAEAEKKLEDAAEEEELEDRPLDQDDIAALFK